MPNAQQLEQELINIYTKAQLNLITTINQNIKAGKAIEYQKALLNEINQILAKLNSESITWAKQAIPLMYKQGTSQAMNGLASLGAEYGGYKEFITLHQQAVRLLTANTMTNLVAANEYIGRSVGDNIRKFGLQAATKMQVEGYTPKEAAKYLETKLISNGYGGVITKSGRTMRLDTYSAVVSRSTIREATNSGTMNHLQYNGYDLVKMSTHAGTCPICAPLQGRVYSISGKDSRYPPLSTAFSGGYTNIHPRCRHTIMPYVSSLADNSKKDMRYSNRPFNTDPRSKAEIDQYNARQAKNTSLRNDKYQYERYKQALGSDAPKTFSGFRKMKKANSDNYTKLKAQYRSNSSQ